MGRFNASTYQIFLMSLGLIVVAGLLIVLKLRRDVADDAPATDDDVLKDIERAFYAGQMDRAEFERVTASLRAKSAGVAKPKEAMPGPIEPANHAGDGGFIAPTGE